MKKKDNLKSEFPIPQSELPNPNSEFSNPQSAFRNPQSAIRTPNSAIINRLLKNRLAVAGGVIVIVFITMAILAPLIAPYSYKAQNLSKQYQPPNTDHLLGTDSKGRDLLTRIMYGSRISLAVGFVATAVSILIGVTYGTIAGYFGGKVDNYMMRFVDVMYGLPFMFLVILMMTILGRNIYVLFIALGAVQWLTMARIVRGQTVTIKEREFVEAAMALGASNFRIITRHIAPNLLGPVIVFATLTIPTIMLEEAFLSFLGLGVQPPMASWGSLAADGIAVISPVKTYWWLVVFPGSAIAITLFSLNFLGDGLRDTLDMQSKNI
ncbi:MAG: ABC transporter permease [Candidatus Anammoxibacter sp.]